MLVFDFVFANKVWGEVVDFELWFDEWVVENNLICCEVFFKVGVYVWIYVLILFIGRIWNFCGVLDVWKGALVVRWIDWFLVFVGIV